MDIKFEKFVNIGEGSFSVNTPLTILIGNNGVGKTLLLEAYAKTNDYIVEKILNSSFIDKLIRNLEFKTEVVRSSIKNYTSLNHGKIFSKLDEKKQPGKSYIFEIKSTITNQKDVAEGIEALINGLIQELQVIIKKEILFMDDKDSQDELLKSFIPDISIPFSECLNECTIEYEICLNFVDSSSDDLVFNTDKQKVYETSDDNDYLNLSFTGEKGFKGFRSSTRFITREENELNREYIDTNNYDFVHNMLKEVISNVLRNMTIQSNSLKEISYIPSERIVSMSRFMEKQLLANDYNGLRYSEEKFAKEYMGFKEYYTLTSSNMKDRMIFEDSYKKILGGTPLFDESGEITKIETENGEIVNRTLFSTKQNKIYPFFMLNQNYRNKSYNMFNQRIFRRRFDKKIVIIEEPEANLSTKGILEMAEYIFELNQKYQIILSTHSDVFLAQINNIYLENKKIKEVSGYEIIDTTFPFFIKKLEVSDSYGVSSDFITSQLELLYQNTEVSQNKIIKDEKDRAD